MTKHDSDIQFLIATHAHIHENIRFADTKAGAFLVLNTTLFGFIVNTYVKQEGPLPATWLLGLTSLMLWLAIGACFGVIWPRNRVEMKLPGLVSPDRIAGARTFRMNRMAPWMSKHEIEQARQRFLDEFPDDSCNLIDEQKTLIFDRSMINVMKYDWLIIVIATSLIAWLLAGCWWCSVFFLGQ